MATAEAASQPEDLAVVAPEVWRLRVPIPVPLRFVNCYLVRGPRDEWALVDAAIHDEVAEAAWLDAFRRLRISPRQVRRILLTHYHPDHYGASGWLQELTGAEVLMLDVEARGLAHMYRQPTDAFADGLLRSGVPAELVEDIRAYQRVTRGSRIVPHPKLTTFAAGETVELGEYRLQAIHAPGHTDGSAVFLDRDASFMIAGDVVLAKITPNISSFEGFGDDPLGDYLRTLESLRALEPRLTVAGHRQPIPELPARCEEILAHHEDRLARTFELARPGVPAWAVASGLFGDLARTNTMFAVGEAQSHLEHLVRRGELRKWRAEDGILYGAG